MRLIDADRFADILERSLINIQDQVSVQFYAGAYTVLMAIKKAPTITANIVFEKETETEPETDCSWK